ncbi:MAG TPA: DNA topoisomerase VI subunit B [Planctomycetes bacterium]|nr:DNA topoisomerase VI subunit B [Planctomycetota bacterium]
MSSAAGRTQADLFAERQREISVSEFFSKNRHLLGFDSPKKALMTAVKEAVDNSLDACEEARILPEIWVRIDAVDKREDRFIVSITDNGPGIAKSQVARIFGKLLYGSKFHRLKMSRGQQGIGISAAGMYGLLTTGKSTQIYTRTSPALPARYFEVQIDTRKNEPMILKEQEIAWREGTGTQVVIELAGTFQRGRQSVDEYLYQTAMANPHVAIHYSAPDGKKVDYERATEEMSVEPREIKPHPYGVELGVLIRMLKDTKSRTLSGFLQEEFSRVSRKVAEDICDAAGQPHNSRPSRIAHKEAEALFKAINETRIMRPPTDCLSPIGAEAIERSLRRLEPDFAAAATRPPEVYRGNPFQIEVGVAYGIKTADPESQVELLRFANRVPLLYQKGACAVSEAVMETAWRSYGLSQSKGSLPYGPAVVFVHMASVWVPFTSESKEAVAHYPEIIKEIKLGLQECGRKLSIHLSRRRREREVIRKRSYIEKYLPHVVIGLKEILGFKERDETRLMRNLKEILGAPPAGMEDEPDDPGGEDTAALEEAIETEDNKAGDMEKRESA